MFGRFNGAVFVFLLFITSFLGAIFILLPFVPLAYYSPKTWRFCADRFVGYWLSFPASLCSFVFGVKFHVTGDLIRRDRPAILLMNHRTRLDWLFLWNALYRMDPWLLTSEKISLKSDLKRIPGAGWAMGCGAFIFLERSFDTDKSTIEKIITYYRDSGRKYQLLLFPEGTDRGRHAIEKDDKFADANGLERNQQVLHPRVTGFNYLLHLMRELNYVDYVYDITVAYSDHIVQSEKDLFLKGRFPGAIHFDVSEYSATEIPVDPEKSAQWLRKKWAEKEVKLRSFYGGDLRLQPSGKGYEWPVEMSGTGYYLAFAFWIFSSLMWLYFCYIYWAVRVYVGVASAFYMYAFFVHNGVEFLLLEWFYLHKEQNTL